MTGRPIRVEQFTSAFKSTLENSVVLSERKCVSAKLEHERYLHAGLLDSDLLATGFDLSKSFIANVEIYFYDYSNKELGEALEVVACIEGYPDLIIPFSPTSPLKQFFQNEYKIVRFGKSGFRRSAYTDLIRAMQKKSTRLLFDAVLDYKAYNDSSPGEGLVTIRMNLPNYNYLFGHLKENGFI
jgi:hypothetical protein